MQCQTDACCDANTCKLKFNAKCDDVNDGCCKNCQVQTKGFVCRNTKGICDIAETCDGVSASCPDDRFVPDLSGMNLFNSSLYN
jgi:hypothetical protein